MKKIATGIYILFLVGALFCRTTHDIYGNYFQTLNWHINIIPFRTIFAYIGKSREGYAIKNIIGNVIMFVPMGYILQDILGKYTKYSKTLLIATGVIIVIEIAQLVSLKGMFDVDDIILNLLGVTVGYIVYKIMGRKKSALTTKTL